MVHSFTQSQRETRKEREHWVRKKKHRRRLGWCISPRASISRRLQFEAEETVRISLRTPLLCSHPKSVCEVSGWRAERHFIGTDSSYFITSLFTWSKTRSSAVPAGDTASCWRSGICDPQLKTQKGISDDLSFPGSCAATEKNHQKKQQHGNLWLFGGAWEMPCRPRT